MRASSVYGICTLAYTDRVSFATRVKNGELAERVVHKGLPYLPTTVGSGHWRRSSVFLLFDVENNSHVDEIFPIYGIYLESAKQGSQQV